MKKILKFRDVLEAENFDRLATFLARNPLTTIAIVATDLPGFDLEAGLAELSRSHPSVRFALLGRGDHPREVVLKTFADGANGYIPQDMTGEDILVALNLILAGHIYVPAGVLDRCATPEVAPVADPASSSSLTTRQRQVLEQLAAGKSNKEIARSMNITEGTVKVHIATTFRLLGVHNRVSAAAVLRRLTSSLMTNVPKRQGTG